MPARIDAAAETQSEAISIRQNCRSSKKVPKGAFSLVTYVPDCYNRVNCDEGVNYAEADSVYVLY
ncbi:MAG: hypothetical protein K9L75_05080 [Spirochaetia bacterium]|nr:hypothetical protein [Spirochaetia bacterium]